MIYFLHPPSPIHLSTVTSAYYASLPLEKWEGGPQDSTTTRLITVKAPFLPLPMDLS